MQAAVDALGYVPSAIARNLSTGRRGSIGVVVESSQGLWFMQLLAGIEEELALSHGSLMLASLALHGTYDDTVVRTWIAEHRVDGILLGGSVATRASSAPGGGHGGAPPRPRRPGRRHAPRPRR